MLKQYKINLKEAKSYFRILLIHTDENLTLQIFFLQ